MMTRSRKIVLAINDLKGNGAERFVITLADELQAQGHACHIVCFKRLQELDSARPLQIHFFPMPLFRWIPRRVRGACVARLLDAFIRHKVGQPDLVLSNLLPVDRILCASRLPNVHLIVHNTMSKEVLSDPDPQAAAQKQQQMAAIYYRKPVVCVSEGVLADFRQHFPGQPNAQRIYNPVDQAFVRAQAAAPNPIVLPQYLVHVGKFKQAKRHDRLLQAYALSKVSIPLVLVGQGELLAACQALTQQLGIADRVIFAGFQKNPYPIIAGASAMLLSSDFEGLGLVILEALALDVPVISTDCPSGPAEILPAANLVPMTTPTATVEALAARIAAVAADPTAFKTSLSTQFSPAVAARQYLALE